MSPKRTFQRGDGSVRPASISASASSSAARRAVPGASTTAGSSLGREERLAGPRFGARRQPRSGRRAPRARSVRGSFVVCIEAAPVAPQPLRRVARSLVLEFERRIRQHSRIGRRRRTVARSASGRSARRAISASGRPSTRSETPVWSRCFVIPPRKNGKPGAEQQARVDVGRVGRRRPPRAGAAISSAIASSAASRDLVDARGACSPRRPAPRRRRAPRAPARAGSGRGRRRASSRARGSRRAGRPSASRTDGAIGSPSRRIASSVSSTVFPCSIASISTRRHPRQHAVDDEAGRVADEHAALAQLRGHRPRRSRASRRRSRGVRISSTSGISATGLKKCMPTSRSGWRGRRPSRSPRARTCSSRARSPARTTASSSAKTSFFTSSSSKTASSTRSQSAKPS